MALFSDQSSVLFMADDTGESSHIIRGIARSVSSQAIANATRRVSPSSSIQSNEFIYGDTIGLAPNDVIDSNIIKDERQSVDSPPNILQPNTTNHPDPSNDMMINEEVYIYI